MFGFGKKKSKYVVKQRSKEDQPFIIPYISRGNEDNLNDMKKLNQFASPMHGRDNKDEMVIPKNTDEHNDISKWDFLRKEPIKQKADEYNEFNFVEPKHPKKVEEKVQEEKIVEKEEKNEEINVQPKEDNEISSSSFDQQEYEKSQGEEESYAAPSNNEFSYNNHQEYEKSQGEENDTSNEEEFEFDYNEEEVSEGDPTLDENMFGVDIDEEQVETKEEPKKEEIVREVPRNQEYSKPEYNNDAKPVKMEKPEKIEHNPNSKYTMQELAIINSGHKPLEYKNYKRPPMDLLEEPVKPESNEDGWVDPNIEAINATLKGFRIAGEVVERVSGPTFTRYSINLAPGVSGSRITSIQNDLQRSLQATSLRIQNPIPGKAYVGVEVPNKKRRKVCIRELIDRPEFLENKDPLSVPIGLDVEGNCEFVSIGKLPHALVAGASGSGKSVFINSVVTSLMYKNSPEEVRFFFIDPKQVDLQAYKNVPHLLCPIIPDAKGGIAGLKWLIAEMERRLKIFAIVGCSNIHGYRDKRKDDPELKKIPFIIAIIDECGDFLMNGGNEAQDLLTKLIQKCRAAGIHIFLAMQKPIAKQLSTAIKSNATGRFAFRVTSQTDSFTILEEGGAENLLGQGDMIYHNNGSARYQAAFIDDFEVRKITAFVSEQGPQDFYFTVKDLEEKENTKNPGKITDDEFYKIARFVVDEEECSTNQICKNFNIGYNRANDIVNQLEYYNIVSANKGTRAREVLLTREELEEVIERIKEENGAY